MKVWTPWQRNHYCRTWRVVALKEIYFLSIFNTSLYICEQIIDGATRPEHGIDRLHKLIRIRYPTFSPREEDQRYKYGVIYDIGDLAYEAYSLMDGEGRIREDKFQELYDEWTFRIKNTVGVALTHGIDFRK